MSEAYGPWYYPTPNDYNPPGVFTLETSSHATGDFNGDGHQDLLIGWVATPHTVERVTPVYPTVFLNDGHGGLLPANTNVVGDLPNIHMGYRLVVADFNGDGVDDFAQGSMGRITRLPDGTFDTHWDPMTLVLSQPDRTLRDASKNIEGQEYGAPTEGLTFAHDTAAGDIDGDGDIDLYSGKVLLLNDGTGHFKNESQLLPEEARPTDTNIMSSVMADLDNDGVDDLVSAQFNGGTNNVFFSRWSNGTPGWQKVQLPGGLYGSNTNFNDVTVADINGDGLKDILFAETRRDPYYTGRAIHILVNKGGGIFADETGARISNAFRDAAGGEGELNALDIDGDGDLDLIDSSVPFENGRRAPSGTSVALNDGAGHFTWVNNEVFAYVQPFQIAGYEHLENMWTQGPGRMIPIDLDGKNGLDFVGLAQPPLLQWPVTDPQDFIMFTALNTVPLGRGIDGTSGGEVLAGTAAADLINGFSGNDTLRGYGGNDRLNGGKGNDRLEGGKGNDTYVVDSSRDTVIEAARGGRDTLLTSVSYALSSSAEVEVLSIDPSGSTAAINLTGNKYSNSLIGSSGRNTLKGGDGNDNLYGGLGNDRLYGGPGKDVFIFNTSPHKTQNMDTISDFSTVDDTIKLDNAVFTKVGATGRLKPGAFWIGGKAHDQSDRIIYDDRSGALYYDADGTGKSGPVKFAQLTKGLGLTESDFYVI